MLNFFIAYTLCITVAVMSLIPFVGTVYAFCIIAVIVVVISLLTTCF